MLAAETDLSNTLFLPMSAPDAVDGSSTGIAMCQIAPAIQSPPMSLIGTLRTSMSTLSLSAFGGKADIRHTHIIVTLNSKNQAQKEAR